MKVQEEYMENLICLVREKEGVVEMVKHSITRMVCEMMKRIDRSRVDGVGVRRQPPGKKGQSISI